jgi:uncharacterized membrane protein (UPF0136 family)
MASVHAPAPLARPMPVAIAVVLSAFLVLGNLLGPVLPQGSGDDTVPAFIIVSGVVLGLVGIAAAVGLWQLRRWGMILTIVVSAVNLLSAAPGIAFAPNAAFGALATLTVLASIAVIVLALRPEARRAYR